MKWDDVFLHVFLGNSAQIGVEDILAWWDKPSTRKKPRVKLLYMEKVDQSAKFLRTPLRSSKRLPHRRHQGRCI